MLNTELLNWCQGNLNVGNDQPIINFFMHKSGIDFKILPYEFNMQDMPRKEILDIETLG